MKSLVKVTCFMLLVSYVNVRAELVYQIFYSFGTVAGAPRNPNAGLTQGLDGNLYGTTTYGPPFDDAKVFRISFNGQFTNLPSYFAGSAYSTARLLQSADGNLYGVTTVQGPYFAGGKIGGTLFKASHDGASILASFWGTTGQEHNPWAL